MSRYKIGSLNEEYGEDDRRENRSLASRKSILSYSPKRLVRCIKSNKLETPSSSSVDKNDDLVILDMTEVSGLFRYFSINCRSVIVFLNSMGSGTGTEGLEFLIISLLRCTRAASEILAALPLLLLTLVNKSMRCHSVEIDWEVLPSDASCNVSLDLTKYKSRPRREGRTEGRFLFTYFLTSIRVEYTKSTAIFTMGCIYIDFTGPGTRVSPIIKPCENKNRRDDSVRLTYGR